MAVRTLCVVVILCILSIVQLCPAQETAAGVSIAKARGWDDAWSWGNALAVKTYFEQLYYPHAIALLDAERKLASGAKPTAIVDDLKSLPGIKGTVVLSTDEKTGDAQWPESAVKLDALAAILFNSSSAQSESVAPMMHRTVGGKVRFQQVPMGDGFIDLLVRYVRADTEVSHPVAAIVLVMDEKWLVVQIPSAMDSLYRENIQLLFCAASPTNHIWEQSLGIIADKDTLWWVGRKDVKVLNEQILWPFENIQVLSYVHTLEKK